MALQGYAYTYPRQRGDQPGLLPQLLGYGPHVLHQPRTHAVQQLETTALALAEEAVARLGVCVCVG